MFYYSAEGLSVVLSLAFSTHLPMLLTVITDVQIENVPAIHYNSLIDRINRYIYMDADFSSTVDHNLKQWLYINFLAHLLSWFT